ncbi:hypothetical protein [Psychrobacillus sp. L3]|uniref:hypothetical protein n=1 Tax=Psychrobacillus sp. L3 TaxID=3236891 RepID=UPI0036F21FAC
MDKLLPRLKELLLYIHARHTATMGPEECEKHSIDNIVKVVVDPIIKCLKVNYKHEWYHYTAQGTWY